ncbi:MAG: phage tail protein [Burkholderiaceae bacterium]|jgi:hypothetical protein|nr:phage tail protein [Burkholderiaceae bacterium]
MSYSFSDGSRFFLGKTLGAVKNITDATNASPVVLTVDNNFSPGDEVLVTSGWDDLTDTVYVPSEVTFNSLTLGGVIPIDTTDVNFFPPGSGMGTVQKVESWVEIGQTLGINSSGGDPKFVNIDPLARRNAIQVPVGFNAHSLTIDIGYDPTLQGYQELVAAARALQRRAFKFVLTGGQTGYGFGYVAVNEMPKLQKGQPNQVSATISLLGKFVGYQQ